MSEPTTLNELFRSRRERWPDKPLLFERGEDGVWSSLTYSEVGDRAERLARGLASLGVSRGDRVGLLCENRTAWALSDLAIAMLGAVNVPLYVTSPKAQLIHILRDAGAVALICSTEELLVRGRAVREAVEPLETLIVIDEARLEGDREHTVAAVEAAGEGSSLDVAAIAADVKGEELASLIYTSGTTGEPKGVMLTHHNFTSNAVDTTKSLPLNENDRHLSFLPLCHAFERTAGWYLMMTVGAEIWYVPSVDVVVDRLSEIRPTIFISVPRLYEKVRDKVVEKINARGLGGRIARWAYKQARKDGDARLADRSNPTPKAGIAWKLADKLLMKKIRNRFGGRIRFMCSGGAPLPPDVWRFFYDMRLHILEGYGLTETSPIVAINQPTHFEPGTVGPLIANVEARIADDGEVLIKGPCNMQGYFGMSEATAEVFDGEWLKTGDLGSYENGFLAITGRKKEILVTSGGKNVAPAGLEALFKSDPLIAECVVCGDGKNYLSALIVPDWDALVRWATERGKDCGDRGALCSDEDVRALFRERLDGLSGELARYETIKRFCLLADEFTQEDGLLTPTMKVRRKAIYARYQAEIEALYDH